MPLCLEEDVLRKSLFSATAAGYFITQLHGPPPSRVDLETSCSTAGVWVEECCAHSSLPPALPLLPTMGPTVTNNDSCMEDDGVMKSQGFQDSTMEESLLRRKEDRMPFQIFPAPVDQEPDVEGSLCQPPERERLPSIVVEPTDSSEVESGELRWPPEDVDQEDDEDLFLEQCIPPANIADWANDEEDEEGQNEEEFQDDAPVLLPDSGPALN
ncbi:hypothetical protein GN956_G8593 [Arapaima gigas]